MSNVGGSTPRGGSRAGEAQIFGRRAGLALAAIVALIGLAASARSEAHAFPTQGNLITTNSSFEVDANNDGFADGWVEYVNVATANLSAVEFVDGAHSQHLTTDQASAIPAHSTPLPQL